MTIRQVPTAGYSTIQAAVDAAGPGDIVEAAPGTYPEAVTVGPGKDRLRIAGAGAGASIIDGRKGRDPAGFHIAGSAYVTISGFTVSDAAGAGMQIDTANNLLRDVDVRRCRGAGYVAGPDAAGTAILEASVRENDQGGIDLGGAHCSVIRCDVANNADHGIAVRGEGCLLLDNVVEGNSGDGVVIKSGANRLMGNECLANTGSGIALESGDANLLIANEVEENQGEGISVRSGSNRLVDNLAGSSEGGGIRLLETAAGNIVDDNLVESNSGPGIALGEAAVRNTVRANTALGNEPDIAVDLPADGANAVDGNDCGEGAPPGFQ